MTYNPDRFLADHPVFRREEFVLDLKADQGLSLVRAEGRANGMLPALCREKRLHKVPKGPYISYAVMEEAPEWLPYAVAASGAPDAVLGLQAALWLQMGREAPTQLHIFSSTLEIGFLFEDSARNKAWEIIPIQSKLGSSSNGDPLSVPGIHEHESKFQNCPFLFRATTPERTLVDILDGLARRPRKSLEDKPAKDKPAKDKPATVVLDGESSPGGDGEGLGPWPSPVFKACWEALSSEDLHLNFDEVLKYLKNQPRNKATTAKVRFFFTIQRERFKDVKDENLRELSPLPEQPHYWTRSTASTKISRLNLVVPDVMIPPGFNFNTSQACAPRSRTKDGIRFPGIDLELKLKDRFWKYKITKFRMGQKAIVEAVLEGRDAIAILPTGAGKSLTYQFPATLLDGPILVISPLVALVNDQVREARHMELIAHSLPKKSNPNEIDEVSKQIKSGELDLIFASPESWPRVLNDWPVLRHELRQIVVDEAHLINSWGQDFRFAYQSLSKLREKFPEVPILALSATLTRSGRKRIVKELGLKAGMEVQKLPVKRPHLYLHRRLTPGDFESRYKALLEFLSPRKAFPGIVYCKTKKDAEKLTEKLSIDLFKDELQLDLKSEQTSPIKNRVCLYHAKMPRKHRAANQESFLNGDCKLMVCTVAFGMGVNKPDIGYIAHFGSPSTLEEYVQEVGRAGRKGQWADCLLIYSKSDWVEWSKRFEKGKLAAMADKSAKGQWKQKHRLERLDTHRIELGRMKWFVRSKHRCLHYQIEKAYYDKAYDKVLPSACLRSCDVCLTPDEHLQQVREERAMLEPCPPVVEENQNSPTSPYQ